MTSWVGYCSLIPAVPGSLPPVRFARYCLELHGVGPLWTGIFEDQPLLSMPDVLDFHREVVECPGKVRRGYSEEVSYRVGVASW